MQLLSNSVLKTKKKNNKKKKKKKKKESIFVLSYPFTNLSTLHLFQR